MWSRKHVLVAICMMLTLMSLACGNQVRTASAVTAPHDTGSTFDPRAFVCELAGLESAQSVMIDGQRYLQDERARARDVISRELVRLGLRPQHHIYTNGRQVYYPEPDRTAPFGNLRGVNLFAELPATGGSEGVIVVGAHYDTLVGTPGADDNASGVAAVLMVARRLRELPFRRHDVIFAFFDQEEEWLVGSDRFAGLLVHEGRRIVTVHNIDMVGWDGDGDRMTVLIHGTYREPRLDNRYMDLYGLALGSGPAEDLPRGVSRTDSNRGEHTSFEMRGFDAVTLMEEEAERGDFNPNYHLPSDTCDSLDYGYLRACANLVAAAVTRQLSR